MRAREFNPQIFLEFLCCSVFGTLIFYLVISGEYLSYVTPRMKPYLLFTGCIMGTWALTGLGRLFRPQHKIRSVHCLVLVIPVLLLLLPHSSMNISDLPGNYAGGNTHIGQSNQISDNASLTPEPSQSTNTAGTADNTVITDAEDATVVTDAAVASLAEPSNDSSVIVPSSIDSAGGAVPAAQTETTESEISTDLPGLDIDGKKITVTNDEFVFWLTEICKDPKKYVGYTVVMTGYVYLDPEIMKNNEFVPARLMMTCCVADLSPVGLICKYDKVSELEKDTWVTVEGTLFIGQYEYNGQKYDDPEIAVTKITPAEKVEDYVYPY